VAHQKIIRDQRRDTDADVDLFGAWWDKIDVSPSLASIQEVTHKTAKSIIEKYEWLGTYANAPLNAFGIYWEDCCAGVVVYGAVSPPSVARSIHKHPLKICQLARGACVHWAHPHAASMLISGSLRAMRSKGYEIVVAYSDPEAGEIGTVYQATNWLYCGMTEKRPDYFYENGSKHQGHFKPGQTAKMESRPRTQKHRYIHILGSRTGRRKIKRNLLWSVSPYPKR
jgi:hypothetical protein